MVQGLSSMVQMRSDKSFKVQYGSAKDLFNPEVNLVIDQRRVCQQPGLQQKLKHLEPFSQQEGFDDPLMPLRIHPH